MTVRLCAKCDNTFWEKNINNFSCPSCKTNNECEDKMGKRKKKKNKNKENVNIEKNFAKTYNSTGDEAWEVKIDCVNSCGKAPSNIIVWMSPLAKEQMESLMSEYKNIEWLAYLLGEWKDENTPVVNELFIPEQTVTATSVTNITCPEHNDLSIIGVIHSHHGMGHSFSQTDNDWINQNHNISIVVSHSGMDAIVRWKTPCGSLIQVKAKTKLWYEVDFNSKDFLKKAKEKIKRLSRPITTTNYPNNYSNPYNWNNDNFNNRLNNEQQRYVNGVSPKTVPEVSDDKLTDMEDDQWDTEVSNDNDETLKDALLKYEEELKKKNR